MPTGTNVLNAVFFINIASELKVLARLFVTDIAIPVKVTGARCPRVNAKVNGMHVTWQLM